MAHPVRSWPALAEASPGTRLAPPVGAQVDRWAGAGPQTPLKVHMLSVGEIGPVISGDRKGGKVGGVRGEKVGLEPS